MQKTILDAIPAHLAMLDKNGNIIFNNEHWERFFSHAEGSLQNVQMERIILIIANEPATHSVGQVLEWLRVFATYYSMVRSLTA